MAMLPPKYNHLGRSRKKRRKTPQALVTANEEHVRWLKKMGVEPAKRRKRVYRTVELDNAALTPRAPNVSPTSDCKSG